MLEHWKQSYLMFTQNYNLSVSPKIFYVPIKQLGSRKNGFYINGLTTLFLLNGKVTDNSSPWTSPPFMVSHVNGDIW